MYLENSHKKTLSGKMPMLAARRFTPQGFALSFFLTCFLHRLVNSHFFCDFSLILLLHLSKRNEIVKKQNVKGIFPKKRQKMPNYKAMFLLVKTRGVCKTNTTSGGL